MDFESALQYLDSLKNYEKTPFTSYDEEILQLDRLKKFLHEFGVDYSGLKFVHVAGSKGKGSVCSLIANYLWKDRELGSVGLFSSPHILDVRERVWLDGEMVSEQEFASFFANLKQFLDASDFELSYFEALFVLALKVFVDRGVDFAVLETGLGGRLDATNIVRPVLSVLTTIELEHTDILGDTLEEIIEEKLGIKKSGVPILLGYQSEEVESILFEKLSGVNDAYFMFDGLETADLQNRKLAMTALRFVLKDFDEELFLRASEQKLLPGRLEVREVNGRTVVFDMAHTVNSAKALRQFLEREFEGKEFVFYFGMLRDKNLQEFWEVFAGMVGKIAFADCHPERGLNAEELKAKWILIYGDGAVLNTSFEGLLANTKKDQVIVVTGSHYLVAKVLSSL